MNHIIKSLLIGSQFVLLASAGQLQLPDVISDHMVLQRDIPVKIWGMASSGANVLITFAGQKM